MHLDAKKEMMSQCAALLGKFIAVRESNIRYLGLGITFELDDEIIEMCEDDEDREALQDILYKVWDATSTDPKLLAYIKKEDNKKLKQKQRERMQPKMGKLDIDYQCLDSFSCSHP